MSEYLDETLELPNSLCNDQYKSSVKYHNQSHFCVNLKVQTLLIKLLKAPQT